MCICASALVRWTIPGCRPVLKPKQDRSSCLLFLHQSLTFGECFSSSAETVCSFSKGVTPEGNG